MFNILIIEHVQNFLAPRPYRWHTLNMFKTAPTEKSDATREHILDTAVGLFREQGMEATTMRQIAREAEVAVGLAYYYFPAKEAVVLAYYDRVQREHRLLAERLLPDAPSLQARLAFLLHTKIDILAGDRKLLGGLFRYTGEPDHPLSFLGPATAPLRAECTALFAAAVEPERLPDDLGQVLPTALWALHMGILLFFLYDSSPNLQRTRALIDGSVSLTVRFLALAKSALLRPVRRSVIELLRSADLLPQA